MRKATVEMLRMVAVVVVLIVTAVVLVFLLIPMLTGRAATRPAPGGGSRRPNHPGMSG